FQTLRDARNFLAGAARFLPAARLEWEAPTGPGALVWPHRQTRVRAFPIAVTPAEVECSASAPLAEAEALMLRERITRGDEGHRVIVRVDRMEPTKNIVRGFQAFERLLKRHAEWHGRVTFLALLVPSRQGLMEYRTYERHVLRTIERINARFGRADWQPIVYILENNRARALALMRGYDVLLVNPVIDGMNLVVKEGGLINERDGVIVLSRTAGAHEQLGAHVQSIPPMDVEETAEALLRALEMPPRHRAYHARALRALLERESAPHWLEAQLQALPTRATALPRIRSISGPRPPLTTSMPLPTATPRSPLPPIVATRARHDFLAAGWADDPAALPSLEGGASALSGG
ncbi:MAG: trehalose-6-phosphate synthase, partial [Ktedonobacterales bacterium]|nr:trehalose-6-phosphate synthase [Ktedonobacterales bacterium]